MKRVSAFSVLLLALVLFSGVAPALAWDVPDKVWINNSMPPKYWKKSGGLMHKSGCSLQRYELFRAGGASQDIFRWAVICPKDRKFCVQVLEDKQHPGGMPIACRRPLPDSAVNFAVSSVLYSSEN